MKYLVIVAMMAVSTMAQAESGGLEDGTRECLTQHGQIFSTANELAQLCKGYIDIYGKEGITRLSCKTMINLMEMKGFNKALACFEIQGQSGNKIDSEMMAKEDDKINEIVRNFMEINIIGEQITEATK